MLGLMCVRGPIVGRRRSDRLCRNLQYCRPMADPTAGATPPGGGLNYEALAFDPAAASAGQQIV